MVDSSQSISFEGGWLVESDVLQQRIVESGTFKWPWQTPHGLAIISGAAGGGGGGGGAVCIEGLNIFGATGGDGGGGGDPTTLTIRERAFVAAGGNGGHGGDSGSITDGEPQEAQNGWGCQFGPGGDGGSGTNVARVEGRIVSDGGDGGKGYPGETKVVELFDMSYGDEILVGIGNSGNGGAGGPGFEQGRKGDVGETGWVLLVPIFEPMEKANAGASS